MAAAVLQARKVLKPQDYSLLLAAVPPEPGATAGRLIMGSQAAIGTGLAARTLCSDVFAQILT